MFSYFPGNYVWNLSVDIALESGEIEGAGRNFSAGTKLHRASLYYQTAERMPSHGSAGRMAVLEQGQQAFGLPAVIDSERWASKVVDHLETRDDVDPARIGMMGLSLGGYYAPRAVAFEPRFALGAVWGANHDWGEVQLKRLKREGENPVPHYWDHVMWVWGAKDMDAFLKLTPGITLDGVLDRVRVPFLVTHGVNDRQISVDYARRSYDQLVNSPKRELKIFDDRTGGVEHVSVDNMSYGRDFIADWIAETFGERTA